MPVSYEAGEGSIELISFIRTGDSIAQDVIYTVKGEFSEGGVVVSSPGFCSIKLHTPQDAVDGI